MAQQRYVASSGSRLTVSRWRGSVAVRGLFLSPLAGRSHRLLFFHSCLVDTVIPSSALFNGRIMGLRDSEPFSNLLKCPQRNILWRVCCAGTCGRTVTVPASPPRPRRSCLSPTRRRFPLRLSKGGTIWTSPRSACWVPSRLSVTQHRRGEKRGK